LLSLKVEENSKYYLGNEANYELYKCVELVVVVGDTNNRIVSLWQMQRIWLWELLLMCCHLL